MRDPRAWIAAALVAAGMIVGGWFIGHGFALGRADARYVTVKGLAERTVKADLALWPMRFVATGNDLSQVQTAIDRDAAKVMHFLQNAGIAADEIELMKLQVTDRLAQAYQSGKAKTRFIVAQTLMVRSHDVHRIATASQKISRLVEAGVVLSDNGNGGPYYLFTKLTQLKPKMIAVATQNARRAASQFAEDSGSRLHGIRRARQGVFQILARDNAPGLREKTQIYKTVRVVSTLAYRLAD